MRSTNGWVLCWLVGGGGIGGCIISWKSRIQTSSNERVEGWKFAPAIQAIMMLFIFYRLLTHWGRDKIAAFSQTTFSNAFSAMKIFWISIAISLKFVPKGPINNIPALFQIMAWRRPGDKPLSEPMLVDSLTHICVTRPQWIKAWKIVQ